MGDEYGRQAEKIITFEGWFKGMPGVTKFYMTLSLLGALLSAFEVITPLHLYLNADLILGKLEVWRLVSNLLYFGTSRQPLNYLFHSYFMYIYLRDLEDGVFRGKKAGLVYMFMLVASVLSTYALLMDPTIHFLSPAMLFLVLTVWCRKHQGEVLTWFAVIQFDCFYLPWVLLLVSFCLYNNPVINLMGIAAGYFYSYVDSMWIFGTPLVLKALFGEM